MPGGRLGIADASRSAKTSRPGPCGALSVVPDLVPHTAGAGGRSPEHRSSPGSRRRSLKPSQGLYLRDSVARHRLRGANGTAQLTWIPSPDLPQREGNDDALAAASSRLRHYQHGPWRGFADVEFAASSGVRWSITIGCWNRWAMFPRQSTRSSFVPIATLALRRDT